MPKIFLESCFNITMGSYNRAETCNLVGIYLLTCLATIMIKSNCGLYRGSSFLILHYVNWQQIDHTYKNIMKILKISDLAYT